MINRITSVLAILRTTKTHNGLTHRYFYDLQGRRIQHNINNENHTTTVWLGWQPIAHVKFADNQISNITYLTGDQKGTPTFGTNQDQAMVWQWQRDAFGSTEPQTDVDGDGENITIENRLAGQYVDDETGLYYNWHRYYDPTLGRYITSDPIGLGGGVNTYGYVLGNPLMYTDPQGLFVCGGFCIGGAVVGVAVVNWTRNYWNEPVSDFDDVDGWTEMEPNKSIYHQMGPGNENNRKFVSPDGHSEAVFDQCNNLVTDPANEGTYNYFGPDNKVMHVITDVLPYFIFGTSPSDMFNLQKYTATHELMKSNSERRQKNIIESGCTLTSRGWRCL